MRPDHKDYILSNIGKKSIEELARELHLKERKIKKFLEREKKKHRQASKEESAYPARNTLLIAAGLIVVLGFLVYGNSLSGEFIWDDEYLVRDNLYITNPSYLPQVFTKDVGAGSGKAVIFYRPLQILSYMFDYTFWKLNPRGFHLTNTVLHIFVALLLYFLLLLLFKDNLISLLTSLLFVVHPVHTEAVSYISGRADSLSSLFMLLCFLAYIKYTEVKKVSAWIVMVAAFGLALLSREASLILIGLLLLYHVSFRKRIVVSAFLPLVVMGLLYMVLRTQVLKLALADAETSAVSLFARLPGAFAALAGYLRLLILPFGLHMEYGFRLFSWGAPSVIIGIVLFVALIVLAVRRRDAPIVVFSLGWFLVALVPHLGIYPVNAYMAEHWLYLPSIGLFLISARALSRLVRRSDLGYLGMALCVGLVGYFSFLTIRQNTYWKDAVLFYTRTLTYTPESSRVYYNLGGAYKDKGKFTEAISAYRKAIELDPSDAGTYNNLANVYKTIGDTQEAIWLYKKAVELDPAYARGYYNLGNAYRKSGDNSKAIDAYTRALELDPLDAEAHNNLGNAYFSLKGYDEAIDAYKKAIGIDPGYAESYNNLGAAYYAKGDYEQAIALFNKVVKLKPYYADVYHNLGNIYKSQGDRTNAIRAFKKVLEIDPQDEEARNALKELGASGER